MTLSTMRFFNSTPSKSANLSQDATWDGSSMVAPSPLQSNWLAKQAQEDLIQQNQAIAAKGISMVYRMGNQSQTVLQDVTLDIQQGSVQLLMGPSGSGKTTLLSILGGILSPTVGEVSLLGTNITRLSKRKLAQFRLYNIGFIFQGFNLFDALSAVDNIVVALKMKGVKLRQAKQEALYWLEQVGLADKANHLPKDLSGGQKQRVAIARALAGNPPLIMADEPTAALDSHSGQMVIEMLCNLAKQHHRTVLMVTHDPRIQSVADHVAYLEDGQLQAENVSEVGDVPQPELLFRTA